MPGEGGELLGMKSGHFFCILLVLECSFFPYMAGRSMPLTTIRGGMYVFHLMSMEAHFSIVWLAIYTTLLLRLTTDLVVPTPMALEAQELLYHINYEGVISQFSMAC